MVAVKRDVVLEKGATLQLWLHLTYTNGPLTGTPVDLTGYVGRMQVRVTRDSDEVALEAAPQDWSFTEDGYAKLEIDALRTDAVTITSGVYDVELESPGGFVIRPVEGRVKVKQAVTR